jgi:hypothetical protein
VSLDWIAVSIFGGEISPGSAGKREAPDESSTENLQNHRTMSDFSTWNLRPSGFQPPKDAMEKENGKRKKEE